MTNTDATGTAMQKTKLLYGLSTSLEDINAIEEVCDNDGVAVVASTLNEANSQMRKYAVVVLAQLALSLKGQIAMLSDQVLVRVVEMLKDPMPNVVSAARLSFFLHFPFISLLLSSPSFTSLHLSSSLFFFLHLVQINSLRL